MFLCTPLLTSISPTLEGPLKTYPIALYRGPLVPTILQLQY